MRLFEFMTERSCVIVGASHAGCNLAMQLRKEGWSGAISLYSAETDLPYHRPPLSKDFLAGHKELDQFRLRPEKMYQANSIDLRLGTEVVELDASGKTIGLADGTILPFDMLALCTGSLPRRLANGPASEKIFYLRTAADVISLKTKLPQVGKAAIIGGGYIGLETAAVLSQQGIQVSVLEMEERLLKRVSSQQMSDYFYALHKAAGVSVHCNTAVDSIAEEAGGIVLGCSDGSTLAVDVVIVGIGIEPQTGLAQQAALELENGVKVNEYLQTSAADIYALGDCASHPSALYGCQIRLESVQNANDQARTAAVNICGGRQIYDALPWFWSDQYQTKLQIAGLSAGYDSVIRRGEMDEAEGFALFYLRQDKLIAAECVNRPKEFLASKQLIQNRRVVDPAVLQDVSVAPNDF